MKIFLLSSVLLVFVSVGLNGRLFAEEAVSATSSPTPVAATEALAVPGGSEATFVDATPTSPVTSETVVTPDEEKNLEFVSGEVSALDATAKLITLKLYGETENGAN